MNATYQSKDEPQTIFQRLAVEDRRPVPGGCQCGDKACSGEWDTLATLAGTGQPKQCRRALLRLYPLLSWQKMIMATATTTRPELTFDGFGINGPDEYRTRLATFTSDDAGKKYGAMFAAAPELLASLTEIADHVAKYGAVPRSADLLLGRAMAAIKQATGE